MSLGKYMKVSGGPKPDEAPFFDLELEVEAPSRIADELVKRYKELRYVKDKLGFLPVSVWIPTKRGYYRDLVQEYAKYYHELKLIPTKRHGTSPFDAPVEAKNVYDRILPVSLRNPLVDEWVFKIWGGRGYTIYNCFLGHTVEYIVFGGLGAKKYIGGTVNRTILMINEDFYRKHKHLLPQDYEVVFLEEDATEMRDIQDNSIDLIWACYDEETEVLTSEGWKKFKDLNYNMKIATLTKDGKIEYQYPNKIISYNYSGKLLKIKTPFVNLCVTPNHRLYVRIHGEKEFRLIRADELPDTEIEFKTNGIWEGRDMEYFILPPLSNRNLCCKYCGSKRVVKNGKVGKKQRLLCRECGKMFTTTENIESLKYRSGLTEVKIPINDWLEFFGYWLTEGDIYQNSTIELTSHSKENLERFKKAMLKLGLNSHVSVHRNCVRMTNRQLATYLSKFGKSPERYIPREILELPPHRLRILFESMMIGDGDSKEKRRYWTSSERLRDDFQELLLKIGYSGAYTMGSKAGEKALSGICNYPNWCIGIRKEKVTPRIARKLWKKGTKCEWKWIDYNGKVYCVSVPNEVIYVRREGVPVWCGNSPPYWKAERLKSDHPHELANAETYDEFLEMYAKCFKQMYRVMKPDRFVVLQVADVRFEDVFYPLHVDTIELAQEAGLSLHDIVIMYNFSYWANLNVGRAETKRYTSKVHEYLLVFRRP